MFRSKRPWRFRPLGLLFFVDFPHKLSNIRLKFLFIQQKNKSMKQLFTFTLFLFFFSTAVWAHDPYTSISANNCCFTVGKTTTLTGVLHNPSDWGSGTTYGWDIYSGGSWVDLNNPTKTYMVTSMAGTSATYRFWAKKNGTKYYSSITLDKCNALPLTLTSFSANKQGNGVALRWETALEINTDHFEIEKAYDGINFTKLKDVTAAGNSSAIKQYQFEDNEINTNYSYYRLKMVDIDGSYAYSNTIKIAAKNSLGITVGPNPTNKNITIFANGINPNGTFVQMYNPVGVKIYQKNFGNGVVELESFLPGSYFLKITEKNQVLFSTMIIKN